MDRANAPDPAATIADALALLPGDPAYPRAAREVP